MFEFQKFSAYLKAKSFNQKVGEIVAGSSINEPIKNQLKRASFSIVLNIAEGSGRFSNPDRRRFIVISRSSLFECLTILDVLNDEKLIPNGLFEQMLSTGDEISRMLYAMIKKLS